jgi:hypothetical protein
MPGYYDFLLQLYDLSNKYNFKSIVSGSSVSHILDCYGSILGGGRSTIYRLPPITFLEYLYFTNKIKGYDEYSNASIEDFLNYLDLKDLEPGMKLIFDYEYFETWYQDIHSADVNNPYGTMQSKIINGDLRALVDLFADKLHTNMDIKATFNQDLLTRELNEIGLKKFFKKNNKTLVEQSQKHIHDKFSNKVNIADIIPSNREAIYRALSYLLKTGFLGAEIVYGAENATIYNNIMKFIYSANHLHDSELLLEGCNLFVTTPLFYTNLGRDILEVYSIEPSNLFVPKIVGPMLEVYLRGSNALYRKGWFCQSYKLKDDFRNAKGELSEFEVDIFDDVNRLICEVTVRDKKMSLVHLEDYFPNSYLTRVLSTKTRTNMVRGIYRLPYPLLCCMFDDKSVYDLFPSVVDYESKEQDRLKRNESRKEDLSVDNDDVPFAEEDGAGN